MVDGPGQAGIDASGPIRKLGVFGEGVKRGARLGLAEALMQLLNDAVMEAPGVPLDEGILRASGSVHVDGERTGTTEHLGQGGTPAGEVDDPTVEGGIRGTAAFNTPYAARLHEHPEYRFKEAGTGGKFLTSKLDAHAEEYLEHIGERIKGETQGLA